MWQNSPASESTARASSIDRAPSRSSRRQSSSKTQQTPPTNGGNESGNDVPKITRRTHKKSRLGCRNCKTRRIKCDEKRPECANCKQRQVQCDYIRSEAPSTGDFGTGESTNGALRISEIELTYHWITSTSHSLSAWPSGATFWCTNITEIGFKHSHVLHLIFALTALHLASCRPACRDEYVARADHHYGLALPSVTSELASVHPENCNAVFTSVQLICFVSWARGPRPGEFLAFGDSGRSEWLIMFRGVRTTLQMLEDCHFGKSLGSKIKAKNRPIQQGVDSPQYESRLQELRDHVSFVSTSEVEREDNLHSVDVLTNCYQSRYGGVDSEYHVVFAWLYKMSEEFLERLQQHDPIPLIIYAYFVVLMNDMERFWYMKGWTHHVMEGIHGHLCDEHRVWIRWPMAQIGWIPP